MASQDHLVAEPQLPELPLVLPDRLTEEEFVAWCDEDVRAEWVDGEVVVMTPVNVMHSVLCLWLARLLSEFVERHDLGLVVQDVQVRLANQRCRRAPDILFLAKNRLALLTPTCVDGPPDLVIEVVSPDSASRDWRDKYFEYQAAGVREYWIIDPASQCIEAYELRRTAAADEQGASEEYCRLEEKGGVIASTVVSGFWLRTAWLWPQTRPSVAEALRQLEAAGDL